MLPEAVLWNSEAPGRGAGPANQPFPRLPASSIHGDGVISALLETITCQVCISMTPVRVLKSVVCELPFRGEEGQAHNYSR